MSLRPRRLSDEEIEATYGTRDRYLRVCERNLAVRQRETFRAYFTAQRHFEIKLFTEKQWAREKATQLARLRAHILLNRHEPF